MCHAIISSITQIMLLSMKYSVTVLFNIVRYIRLVIMEKIVEEFRINDRQTGIIQAYLLDSFLFETTDVRIQSHLFITIRNSLKSSFNEYIFKWKRKNLQRSDVQCLSKIRDNMFPVTIFQHPMLLCVELQVMQFLFADNTLRLISFDALLMMFCRVSCSRRVDIIVAFLQIN